MDRPFVDGVGLRSASGTSTHPATRNRQRRSHWVRRRSSGLAPLEHENPAYVELQAIPDGVGDNLRVMVSMDDGGWRAFLPLTDGFIIRPDGSFAGECVRYCALPC
jgi:hypothetical protein